MHPWFEKIAAGKILVVGDIMLDRYYFADVTRISPEGPVPVALVKNEKHALGGAANVAHNLALLGCQVSIVGVSGDDENRNILEQKLRGLGIGYDDLLRVKGRPTTTKVRVVGGHQQMLRLDFEDSTPVSAAIGKKIRHVLHEKIEADTDAVILSDYAKGACTPLVCQSVIAACASMNVPLVVDPKGAHWQKYHGAYLVTPNLKELTDVSREKISNEDDKRVVSAARRVCKKFGISSMVVTRSEKGMSVVAEQEPIHIPTYAQEVFDVSGAGDTVAAVLGAGLAAGIPLVKAAHLANLAAGVVVGKIGTYAISRTELSAALQHVENEEWLA